jgi:hypothetical protein
MAGGMVHWTNEGVDMSPGGIMRYVAGDDEAAAADILEKEKAYYAACIDKTLSRLALAKARISGSGLTPEERAMVFGRLRSGVEWLETNKKMLLMASDRDSFEKTIDLKMWHAVKMLPTASEGYYIACSLEKRLDKADDSRGKREAKELNGRAGSTFIRLLNLDGRTDFVAAEKDRLAAFGQLSKADSQLKKASR